VGHDEHGFPILDPRSAEAARRFPHEWAKWSGQTGKTASRRRQQLRQRAETEGILEVLRRSGASCRTCRSFDPTPACGIPNVCLAQSDYYGYVTTKASSLCTAYHAKETA
jgi:hypothetical protein